MAELNIINTAACIVKGGNTIAGKQGPEDDAQTDSVDMEVDGKAHVAAGTLETATAVELYSNDNDTPITFAYMHLWSSVDMFVQIIGATGSVIHHVFAEVPFVLSYDDFLAETGTTPLDGTPPTTESIDIVMLQNNSGGPGDFSAIFYS